MQIHFNKKIPNNMQPKTFTRREYKGKIYVKEYKKKFM